MDTTEDLAARLTAGLKQLPERDTTDANANDAKSLADLASNLHQKMSAAPDELRHLIHTADSGFAATGKWVDDAIAARNDQVKKLARATKMVATWLGPDGAQAERVFMIRGHIRGWAHRWRQENKGTAQIDTDSEFVTFASECLRKAEIDGDHTAIIGKALGADWRTA